MNAARPAIDFIEEGSGEPIVLLHAFPLDGNMWAEQKRELARSARVLVPDLRGFGRSAAVPPALTVDDHADDVAELLDRLAIKRVTLAGLSMGGYIALAFARRHRNRLARLALADTRAAPDSPEGRAARDANIALVEGEGVAALVERLLPKLLSKGAPEEIVTRVRQMAASQNAEGVKAALAAMRDRADSTTLVANLALPTAVIVGEADAISPPSEARAVAALVPGAELEIIPGAGHLSNLEAPAAFTAALRRLMGRA
ncbi:MAG TPA: alpha/beta fold hydrolase [Polyangiaceae bacterium]